MKLHKSGSKFTPVIMRDKDRVLHQVFHLRDLGMEPYDISIFLNVNSIQVQQWLEEL